ncbi:MAG: efflux RND transporter permease subunit, partial [Planctomycetota bacterium]
MGDVEPVVLQTVGRRLHRQLTRLHGIGEVDPIGLLPRQLRVRVDPNRLHASGVSFEQVVGQIRTRAQDLAAGRVDDGSRQRLVRGLIRAETAQALGDIVVRPGQMGSAVRLRHVATVSDAFDETDIVARVDGEQAVLFDFYRRHGGDVIDLNHSARELLAREGESLPDGMRLTAFNDASLEVARTTGVLYENALFGLVLVVLTLGMFMGGRNSLIVAVLGIPVALAAAAVLLGAMDVSINLLSLGALILCLGLVVDDAIVLIENIFRHLEAGKSRLQATLDGTREVMWPVISATLTTCAAFLPLLVMTGVLGEFFAIIPKVVVAVLGASLLEALFILPRHMVDFGGVPRPREESRGSGFSANVRAFGGAMMARYERALHACLRRDLTTLAVAYLVFGGLIAAALATKDVVLLTEGDVNAFQVRVQMPADSSTLATDAALREVERRLERLRTDDVEAVWATRGRSRTEFRPIEEDYVAMATVTLVPLERRSSNRAGRDLLARASGAFDDLVGPAQVQVVKDELGPPVGAPVQVRIAGDDPARLASIAAEVASELRKIDGVTAVENTLAGTKRELLVTVDEGRAAPVGLTASDVGQWLRLALSDAPIAHALIDNERVDLVVKLDTQANTPEAIEALTIASRGDAPILLGDVASVDEGRRATHIERNDRRRGVRVSAQLDGSMTAAEANREARRKLQSLVRANPDFAFEFAGEYRETSRSIRSLVIAFAIAIIVIYSILAAQFRNLLQPFVVIAAIPLSLIGVIVGFFVSGAPVGLIALIGVVGLAGVVVNDSLVLVDFINQRRREGAPTDEAIVAACKLRARPIVVTSMTTITGLLPLAIAGSD